MSNSDGTPTDYERAMLNRLTERFNETAKANGHREMCWNDLPYGVRKSFSEAFFTVADEIQGDMY